MWAKLESELTREGGSGDAQLGFRFGQQALYSRPLFALWQKIFARDAQLIRNEANREKR